MSFETSSMSLNAVMPPYQVINRHCLHSPWPDRSPSSHKTTFVFDVAAMQEVTLDIRDALGGSVKSLVSGRHPAGRYVVTWDNTNENGNQVPAGMYSVRMTAGTFSQTKQFAVK
jgi:flagellar hook assembly protein FlgD